MMLPTTEAWCLHFVFEMVSFSHAILTDDIIEAGVSCDLSVVTQQSVAVEDGDPKSPLFWLQLGPCVLCPPLDRTLALMIGTTEMSVE